MKTTQGQKTKMLRFYKTNKSYGWAWDIENIKLRYAKRRIIYVSLGRHMLVIYVPTLFYKPRKP